MMTINLFRIHKIQFLDKNSSMNNTIIFLSLFIIFLSVIIDLSLSVKLDLNSNKIYVDVCVFCFKILHIDVDILGLYYRVNSSKKIKKISDIFSKENNYFIGQIKKSLLDKLYLSKLELYGNFGLFDAFSTAKFNSVFELICNNLGGLLPKDTYFVSRSLPNFTKTSFILCVDMKINFTIFDMAFALILCFYKRSRYVKKIRKERV